MIKSNTKYGRSGGRASWKHRGNYAPMQNMTDERFASIFGEIKKYTRCGACGWSADKQLDIKECPECGSGMLFGTL